MYEVIEDPYCYKGTVVLRNRLGLRVQTDLDAFEAEATAQRFLEPIPSGRFSVSHYCAIHRHIFGDVFPWAGRFRKVRISKGGSMFCYPEHIAAQMRRLFEELRIERHLTNTTADEFAQKAAHFLTELNAIHPFREGNGRTQLAYLTLLAEHAGHPINLERMEPTAILNAMIASFAGDEAQLAQMIRGIVGS